MLIKEPSEKRKDIDCRGSGKHGMSPRELPLGGKSKFGCSRPGLWRMAWEGLAGEVARDLSRERRH